MSDARQKRTRPSFEETWRKRFIKFSANDDDAGIAGWSPGGLEARFRNFTRVWPGDAEGALWLDVGCGAGTYSRFLAGRGVRVIGMDYSYPTVIKARDRSPDINLWATADVTRLPVESGSLDGILCFGVIQALERSEPAVAELARAVKPGGQVWIDALNSWCLPNVWGRMMRRMRRRPMHLRYESPWKLRRMMKNAGLKGIQLYWAPILPQPVYRYQKFFEGAAVRWILQLVPLFGALLSHAFLVKGERSPATPGA